MLKISPGPTELIKGIKEGEKFMAFFDIPGWLELPLTIGMTFVVYCIGFLILGFATFLLSLAYFLLGDRPK